jgi:hypothetical protein
MGIPKLTVLDNDWSSSIKYAVIVVFPRVIYFKLLPEGHSYCSSQY